MAIASTLSITVRCVLDGCLQGLVSHSDKNERAEQRFCQKIVHAEYAIE